jgi:hypothetical protein
VSAVFKHAYNLVAVALVAGVVQAAPARADHMPEAFAATVDLAVVLPGLALSVPNIAHVVEGRRPSIAWPITGLVLGAVGAGLSTLVLSELRSRDNPSLAIAGLAGSAVEIGFAVWAWAQPASDAALAAGSNRLRFAPFVVRSAGSRPIYGVALTGVGF